MTTNPNACEIIRKAQYLIVLNLFMDSMYFLHAGNMLAISQKLFKEATQVQQMETSSTLNSHKVLCSNVSASAQAENHPWKTISGTLHEYDS
mmetsp:Transcript_41406/g.71951  ORF Transcript_41406/g.71951 Transcript_41406/m.71951 type:complete len:92 (-) Transcript_41406:288-563(-)